MHCDQCVINKEGHVKVDSLKYCQTESQQWADALRKVITKLDEDNEIAGAIEEAENAAR